MRTSLRFLLGLGAAAVVASGGSAFTASNVMTDGEFLGHDTATVSGVTVSNIKYNVNTANADVLDSVEFTTPSNVASGYSAVLSLNGTPSSGAACTFSSFTTTTTITCSAGGASVAGINSVALTVAAQ